MKNKENSQEISWSLVNENGDIISSELTTEDISDFEKFATPKYFTWKLGYGDDSFCMIVDSKTRESLLEKRSPHISKCFILDPEDFLNLFKNWVIKKRNSAAIKEQEAVKNKNIYDKSLESVDCMLPGKSKKQSKAKKEKRNKKLIFVNCPKCDEETYISPEESDPICTCKKCSATFKIKSDPNSSKEKVDESAIMDNGHVIDDDLPF